jgi:ubiquinone biosynthesis accessory factor UbiJ
MNSTSSSTHTIAAGAACRGINHVLAGEPWAMTELSRHANKTILLEMPFGDLGFELSQRGLLQVAPEIEQPSLTLSVNAKALTDIVGSPGNLREQAFKAVKIAGDAELAQLLGRLIGQVRWEYEEDLSRLLGDAPAHFAVKQGKKLISASKSAVGDLLDNVVEYVSEEKKVLLNKRDFIMRKAELNDLRDAVDRMEKRIQLLKQKAL